MHDNKGSKVTQEVSVQRTTRRSVSYPVHSKVMGSPGAETKSHAIKLSNFEIMQQMRVVSYPYTLLQSIRLRVVDCPTQMTVDLTNDEEHSGVERSLDNASYILVTTPVLGRVDFIIF